MHNDTLINYDCLRRFDAASFRQQEPFPWWSFRHFLRPEAFQALRQHFPAIERFEKHENLKREYGQRPHNRYYLAYEKSVYRRPENSTQGVITHRDLHPVWRRFIAELNGEGYQSFMKSLFGVTAFSLRYAWHIGVTGSEVSPHLDSASKIGTHIFYFNTSDGWAAEWGGATLVLGGKRTADLNPDYADFDLVRPVEFLDNHSFLFKNTPDAWHGAHPLRCPEGRYRKLFNAIFAPPERSLVSKLLAPPLNREAWRKLRARLS